MITDRLVTNAVQYIDQCPQAFDSPLPKSEDECIQKIVATLNARQDGVLPGEVFQEHYNSVTESVSSAARETEQIPLTYAYVVIL